MTDYDPTTEPEETDAAEAALYAAREKIAAGEAEAEAAREAAAPRPEFFEQVLSEGVHSLYQTVMGFRARGQPGALKHGATGAHIIIQEILDNANNAQAYLTIAAYAISAALLGGGFWVLPTMPEPEEQVNGEAESVPSDEAAPV